MAYYVKVFEEEHGECMELPLETDATLLLSTLVAQFPGACGLKYRFPDTGAMRGLALDSGKFMAPLEGWKYDFICSFPKENKRKIEDYTETSTTKRRMEDTCVDLIVLGLPWKLTDEQLREHFEQFGELLMSQVKKDMKTGNSKGFGFIRFAAYESQKKVLSQEHIMDGRICEVKIPNSKGGPVPNSNRVFIGRCVETITADDLRTYFSSFGEVTEVYIPKPFRAFAFVTFVDTDVAQRLCGEDHIVNECSIYVSNAVPRTRSNNGGRNNVAPWANGQNQSGPNYNNSNNASWGNNHGNNSGGSGNNWNNGGNNNPPNNGNNMGNMMNPAIAMPLMAALSQACMGQFGGNWSGNSGNAGDYGNSGGNSWQQTGEGRGDRYSGRQQ